MKRFIILLVLAATAAVSAVPTDSSEIDSVAREGRQADNEALFSEIMKNDPEWQKYKRRFRKSYRDNCEEADRYKKFKDNDVKIKEHNEKLSKGKSLHKLGHNHFSDMNEEEINKLLLKLTPREESSESLESSKELKGSKESKESKKNKESKESEEKAPDSLSYKEYCLPVVDQGSCGSCWAFAAAAQVETQLKRKNKKFNTPISAQYLLDCAPNGGCSKGGWPSEAFNYMYQNGLVCTEDYPYVGSEQVCKTNVSRMDEKIASPPVSMKLKGDEEKLKKVLASCGPVVVAVQAPTKFSFYESGVFSDKGCPKKCKQLNHAMLLVGYGTDTTTYKEPVDYWLLKNSWGEDWGEEGYVRMIRNSNKYRNNCNIACFIDYAEV